MKYSTQYFFALLLFTLIPAAIVFAQVDEGEESEIQKGTILTSFNADMISSGNYEQDNVERSFDLGALNVDALYFLNENIGVGPILGMQYSHQYHNFKLASVQQNSRSWNYEYGAKAGYYTPVRSLFNTNALGDAHLFALTGVSWLKNKYKVSENSESQTFKTNPEFKYQVALGLYMPFGERIGMEWKLQRESWKDDYSRFGFSNDNWSSRWSLGLGLKVKF